MQPLMEMMLKSRNGEVFNQIQRQFGLDSNQAEKALEAIMPAFSTGLKRNARQPMDFGAFMQTLSSGRHQKYLDDNSAAFSENGVREGNSILGHLFGSKDTSRAVATQAAQVSGVGEGVIKQMLPVVASMVMGSLFKQSTGRENLQQQNLGNTTPANISGGGILGQILGELVKGGLNNTQQQKQSRGKSRQRSQADNPLGNILEQMMGGGRGNTSQRGRSRTGNPLDSDNPLGDIFEEMLNQKKSRYQPEPEPRQRPTRPHQQTREPDFYEPDDGFEDIGSAERYNQPRQAPGGKTGGLEDLFGDMFETGRPVDEGYQRGVESIFDKFMKR